MLPTLAQKWDTNQAALPPNLPPHARLLAKGMFYAGVAAMMEIQLVLAEDDVSEDQAVEHMKSLDKEVRDWMRTLLRGVA